MRPGGQLELGVQEDDLVQVRAGEAPTGAAARIPLGELEDAAIRDAVMQQARGNDAQAATALGISRTTVYLKVHR